MSRRKTIIAIDGPAGAGKSTIAKELSNTLHLEYVDTGAMYRALTFKVMDLDISINDKEEISRIIDNTTINIIDSNIYLDGTRVRDEIRRNVINNNVSVVSKIKEVRDRMVKIQREMAKDHGLIMDGRDIGTVVFPDADYKFFITASVEERARRRFKELLERDEQNISYEQVLSEIKKRDRIDSTREIAPLKRSSDAYLIDTTNKTVKQCIEEIIEIIEGR